MSRSRIALTVAAAATGLLALGGTALATTSAPAAPTAVTSPASDDPGGALETEIERGQVVVTPHGGAARTTVPSGGAAPSDDLGGMVETEVEHGRVVVEPHGGAVVTTGGRSGSSRRSGGDGSGDVGSGDVGSGGHGSGGYGSGWYGSGGRGSGGRGSDDSFGDSFGDS